MQMMMIKVLQLLGGIVRYQKDGKTVISDADWDKAVEDWQNKVSGAVDPDKKWEGWYWYDTDSKIKYGQAPEWVVKIIAPILEILNSLLIPIIVLLGTAGTIYAIVLGVQYSKAETADKRDEAKKRLINAVIGIVIMLVALILVKIFVANAANIFGWVKTESEVA